MKLFVIALRNVLKNKRRTMTTCISIITGVVAMVVFWGYTTSIKYGLETNIVRESGHLQIQHSDFLLLGSGNPRKYSVNRYKEILDELNENADISSSISAISPRVRISGIAGNYQKSLSNNVVAFGVNPADQVMMRSWDQYGVFIPARKVLLEGTPSDSAIVGETLGKILQYCTEFDIENCVIHEPAEEARDDLPSDLAQLSQSIELPVRTNYKQLDLLTSSASGMPNVASLNLVAVERQGVKSFDSIFLSMHLKQSQQLLYGVDGYSVTSIAIQLKDTALIDLVKPKIESILKQEFVGQELSVRTFKELDHNFIQTVNMFKAIFGFISVLIGIIVVFTIYNSMSTSVVERTIEIGSLRAMGLKRREVRNLFVLEGVFLGAVGCTIGITLAVIVGELLNNSGLTWQPPGYVQEIPLTIVLSDYSFMIYTFIFTLLVSAFSSLLPSQRAAKYKIVEALRHA